jgi:hypothetical protein
LAEYYTSMHNSSPLCCCGEPCHTTNRQIELLDGQAGLGPPSLSLLTPVPPPPAGAAALREEHALAIFVDTEGRTYKGDKFNRFLAELHARIKSLVQSPDPHERLAGVLAIDELAATKVFSQSAARLSDLVKLLNEVFQATTEVPTMQAAAATLGRLVKAGGALMADVVEEQVGGACCCCCGGGGAVTMAAAAVAVNARLAASCWACWAGR